MNDAKKTIAGRIIALSITALLLLSCGGGGNTVVDELNGMAYNWHYSSLDSTEHYARQALAAADGYADGRAEAMNNLAFACLMRMDYVRAQQLLDSVMLITDNQLELLVSYVQQMRRCQRMSLNRDFYDYRAKALQALQRLNEDPDVLNDRQRMRLLYAETEMAIVNSTYYYYVGLELQSIEAMSSIPADVEQDTQQFLNYLYNIGAGGFVTTGTQTDINQVEFDHLMRCYLLSQQTGCAYFAANSLEALAEHLINPEYRERLIEDNLPAMKFINPDGVSDDMLPLWLADNALTIFREYGDTYQIAGAYRTLASCYLEQGDYESALFNLEQALCDTVINQAPDLVASIREQLSVAYAAIDNKAESDRNRNIYLDLQEQTRQDRSLEARAGQLEHSLRQLGLLLWAVGGAVFLLVVVLLFFYWRHRRNMAIPDTSLQEQEDEMKEQLAMRRLHVEKGERRNLEQRAKVSLVNGITPLIDRMLYTIEHVQSLDYVGELADEIERQNQLLTHWIQLRQGELSLHIETFQLQELFDMMQHSSRTFAMKNQTLSVVPTEARVKADRVLTLFMLNTLADNARKFTPEGGTVTIKASEGDNYVEVAVSDTGEGMDEEQLKHVFDHKIIIEDKTQASNINSQASNLNSQTSHGFGLLNCKGIIEKYRKMSPIFSVCRLSAESRVGEGSRFFFRLPKGVLRIIGPMGLMGLMGQMGIMAFLGLFSSVSAMAAPAATSLIQQAAIYADSAYFSNINGTYERTLIFADSCRHCLNEHYRQLSASPSTATDSPAAPSSADTHAGSVHSSGVLAAAPADTLLTIGEISTLPPEIAWLHSGIDINYHIILDIRNESAVAALALHEWQLYQYNNRIYTQLFKELSADSTLDDYCRKMQQSQTNRQVAIILLVLLFVSILVAVVWQLMQTLNASARKMQEHQDRLEMMGDELKMMTQEENALYVSNAVLDNTLSTLKHETMYYPSRIRQLVEQGDTESLKEVVAYYRELYGLLSAQSMGQVERHKLHLKALEHGILGDENLVRFLFDILKKECQLNGHLSPLTPHLSPLNDKYVECRVPMPGLNRTDLFTPSSVANIPFLLCRQIVRDHGEATNRRACAIRAEMIDGLCTIVITLPRAKEQNNKTIKS